MPTLARFSPSNGESFGHITVRFSRRQGWLNIQSGDVARKNACGMTLPNGWKGF
jgi:hypothetical protein